MITKWDKRFLRLASEVGTWSKDKFYSVGAVIVQGKNQIVSLGFNGLSKAMDDSEEILNNRELKNRFVIHAETNAIGFSGRSDLSDCTIYITAPPCSSCLSQLLQRGIRRIVCIEGTEEFNQRYHPEEILKICNDLGVEVVLTTRESIVE